MTEHRLQLELMLVVVSMTPRSNGVGKSSLPAKLIFCMSTATRRARPCFVCAPAIARLRKRRVKDICRNDGNVPG